MMLHHHQMRDPMVEVGVRARALATLGMLSGTWASIGLDEGSGNGHR
jgi:hypothetical protein